MINRFDNNSRMVSLYLNRAFLMQDVFLPTLNDSRCQLAHLFYTCTWANAMMIQLAMLLSSKIMFSPFFICKFSFLNINRFKQLVSIVLSNINLPHRCLIKNLQQNLLPIVLVVSNENTPAYIYIDISTGCYSLLVRRYRHFLTNTELFLFI